VQNSSFSFFFLFFYVGEKSATNLVLPKIVTCHCEGIDRTLFAVFITYTKEFRPLYGRRESSCSKQTGRDHCCQGEPQTQIPLWYFVHHMVVLIYTVQRDKRASKNQKRVCCLRFGIKSIHTNCTPSNQLLETSRVKGEEISVPLSCSQNTTSTATKSTATPRPQGLRIRRGIYRRTIQTCAY